MKKIICSQQVRLSQKTVKAMLVSSIVAGLLLPLSAVAAEDDLDSLTKPVRAENLDDNISLLTNNPVSSKINVDLADNENKENSDVVENKEVKKENSTTENSITTVEPTSQENTSATSALDKYIDKQEVGVTAETPVGTTSKSTDKEPSWMSLEYLLGGGLLLLLLGGGLLLLSKINELKNENKNLAHNNANLKKQSDKQTKLANSAQSENEKLKSEIMRLNTLDEQHTAPVEIDSELSSEWLVETPELIIIDDLNKSDRTQLASIFENWLRTNRGNTDVRDLIPEDIQRKLKDSEYLIEFWGQSDGLDSVEITKNTARTAIISLIKHDNQGYAYCYKKPNSMSALWKNKAWYDVEKENATLKITGEPLETT